MARSWRLTTRHGSDVERETYESLEQALDALERRAEAIRGGERLEPVKMLRDFEPEVQVHARFELSGPGLLRGREAGLDIMGDGTPVPYVGAIRKRRLEPEPGQSPYEALRAALLD